MCFLGIFPLAGFLIIGILIFLKVNSLKKKGVTVKGGEKKKPAVMFFLYPVFLLLLLLWLTALIEATFSLSAQLIPSFLTNKIINSPALEITGTVFIVLSLLLMVITLKHFKSSLRFGFSKINQGTLITTGIFSYSRNPFFLSLILYFIGQAMVFPGFLFIAIALLAVVGIHFFILKEEKFMVNHYQQEYFDYTQKVRRYF